MAEQFEVLVIGRGRAYGGPTRVWRSGERAASVEL